MLENALSGSRRYWLWIFALLAVMAVGAACYALQLTQGLRITGLSRDVTWGFYIAQFTFLVGVAASAVMVVLPYYLHNFRAFGRMTIIGEFLAIAAVLMCLAFIIVDLGQPSRAMNMILYPSPRSILFWDMIVLNGYLVLNVLISRASLQSERTGAPPPRWVKPVIYLSIPWAISIHTVTAFIYAGLVARPFWMTAILGPRFLASAFASGPAILILIALLLRRFGGFDAGRDAISKLATIVTYAMIINLFFVLMELFTAFYSAMPEHVDHFRFMYWGLEGNTQLVPWMWISAALGIASVVILLQRRLRENRTWLTVAAVAVVAGIWIEKGLGMVITGFVPSPIGTVTSYSPTWPELGISAGIYAFGILLVTIFFKITLTVRERVHGQKPTPPAGRTQVAEA
jgi:molybdopterin-containing oxidoreductase family membrane subunit